MKYSLPDNPIDPQWQQALLEVAPQLKKIEEFLVAENERGVNILPSPENIFRAFAYPLDEVKVLIVGQDPYPTAGHATGLAFSVSRQTHPLPRSLNNIYKELQADLGISLAAHGDLSSWSKNGVMLLNRSLTVREGNAGSHAKKGWEEITAHAIRTLVARNKPLVAILWGNKAQELIPLLGQTPIISSAHPSPLSASRGFFGSQPFSRANEMLVAQGAEPINWELEK